MATREQVLKEEAEQPYVFGKTRPIFFKRMAKRLSSADYLRQKYGIPTPFEGFEDDISELRRVASEGLDPLQFRRSGAAQAGTIARGTTQQLSQQLSQFGGGYGGMLSAGLTERYKGAAGQTQLSAFAQLLQQMMTKDYQTRSAAKEQLMGIMLTKQQLDQQLILQEKMIRAQLGR